MRFIGDNVERLIRSWVEFPSETMLAMKRRRRDFPTKRAMDLAGIAADRLRRPALDDYIEAQLKSKTLKREQVSYHPEVIVGGGVHAAIYAATRRAMGRKMPLVIERGRLGGVMAVAKDAAFWLNSRNRPGDGGLPSENAALNYIPGAPVQMSMLSALEFQSNADLAWIVRLMLASSAYLETGVSVTYVTRPTAREIEDHPFSVVLDDGRSIETDRVLNARGLGDDVRLGYSPASNRVMTLTDLLRRLNDPFPLQGMKRVAVIGNGDSSRVAIEALLGQGPAAHMSMAGLDWVEQVDWFTAGAVSGDCATFVAGARSRYAGIGGLLNLPQNGIRRLRVIAETGAVAVNGDRATVNGRPYDHVVSTVGWARDGLWDEDYFYDMEVYPQPFVSLQALARKISSRELYQIGPAAELDFDSYELNNQTSRLAQNRVALFRLGWRTAALAGVLP